MMKLTFIATTGMACAGALGQTCNFEPPETYPINDGGSGASPYYVDSGDIDGDGDLDIVTDSNGPGGDPTPILWNDGTGLFSYGPVLTSGWGFGEVALGDMDSDGDLDVIRANYFDNGVYFFRNNGDGTFSSGTYYAGGGGNIAVVFADIDGDKDLDFVVADKFGGRIRPYRNINGLGFTSVGLFSCGSDPYGMDAGDVDGDGDIDIVVTSETGSIMTLCRNDGTGAFPTATSYVVGERPVDVTLADFNADGALDAAVANWDALVGVGDTVSVLINDGDGSFVGQVVYQAAGFPESVKAADMNGDGNLDLVVACSLDDAIAVLPGNGDGTFGSSETFPAGDSPEFLTLGDFDADGDQDVAVVSRFSNSMSLIRNICDTPPEPPAIDVLWHVGHDNFFNEDIPTHVAIDPNGSVLAAGSTMFNFNEEDYYIVKFDSDGNLLWENAYNGTGDHYDKIYDLKVDSTGAAVVTGESWGLDFGVQWATHKVNADGTTAWTQRYSSINTFSQQRPGGLAIDSSDNVAVCGYYINATFQALFTVVMYDNEGIQQWDKRFPTTGTVYPGQARAVAFDADGNIIATGNIDDDDEFGEELYLVKISPTGTVLWTARFDGTTSNVLNETYGRALYVNAEGDIYVAGDTYTNSTTNYDAVLLKYSPTGTLAWSRVVSGLGITSGVKITALDNGTLIVSGAGGSGVVMHAFDSAGTHLWETTVAASVNDANRGGHITYGSDGFLYLLGQGGSDLSVFQVSTAGEMLSMTNLDSGSASDVRAAITAAPSGVLYALGQYSPEIVNRRDFSLFKLSTAGAPTCPADFNADGELNFFDLSGFLQAFSDQDPSADITNDSVFDFFDVQEFLAIFAAGCP